jgi:limonene-1,2-epoxide hydrolase
VANITAFLARTSEGKDGMIDAINRWFRPDTLWENVGVATTTGPEEAIALLAQFETTLGIPSIRIETLAIAATGNRVLTERIDHLVDAGGVIRGGIRLMGIFELDDDGKITRWSDYFDSAALNTQTAASTV